MKRIVQKFGGTSLDNEQKRKQAVERIAATIKEGYQTVIVVSAMGRNGKPYATDTLINLARECYNPIEPREKDLLMSCGEIISAVIMAQALRKNGIDTTALTGAQAGIITDNNYGQSKIISVNNNRIISLLTEGKTPVVAGFQGISLNGEITTLGRGGSDTTAAVIGAAIEAEFIEIYTDVEGVMTADPGKVKKAQKLEEINYAEVCELAYQGARIIHPRAAEIAMNEKILVKIRSTFSNDPGTVVKNINSDKPITGITSRNDIIFVKIIPRKPEEYATGLRVFKLMSEADISVDFINIRPEAISFVVKEDHKERINELLQQNKFIFFIDEAFVKVSVVGGGMTGQPGIMARIVEALTEMGISIYQTTDSHTAISCLLRKSQEELAVKTLHEEFELNN